MIEAVLENVNINNAILIHRRLNENTSLKFKLKKDPLPFTNKITTINRMYYDKYIKYKIKYIELKSTL